LLIMTSFVAALIAYTALLKKGLSEYSQLRKDPVVQMVYSNAEEFDLMLENAKVALKYKDMVGIHDSFNDFLKYKDNLADSLFSEVKIAYLVEQRIISQGQADLAKISEVKFNKLLAQMDEAIKENEGKKL